MLLALMLLGFGPAALAQSPDSSPAQNPNPAPAGEPVRTPLVRLRYVKGQVSILQGTRVEFAQAKANMPVLAGTTLSAGADGQAEIEFGDGSVARLTPQSQLRLVRLQVGEAQRGATNTQPTDVEVLSGLAYFELNATAGRRYEVRFGRGLAQPAVPSIFRIDFDRGPELAVFLGAVQAHVDSGFEQTVNQGQSLRLGSRKDAELHVSSNIRQDSWDRWNQDRDASIAREAQQQTAAGEQTGAAAEPGWNELDYYGNWYPTEEYGNVWVPGGEETGWDPYSSGYWASYPGWGYTWISGYPWGWLPYQCGAWNYWDSFGWGWIPGQCFFGVQPVVTIWNAPPRFHAPPRPIPSGHIGTPTRPMLLAVHRGPAGGVGGRPTGLLTASHTRPVRIDGRQLNPLPVIVNPALGAGSFRQTGHVGIPPRAGGAGYIPVLSPGIAAHGGFTNGPRNGSGVTVWPGQGTVRPLGTGGPYSSGNSVVRSGPVGASPPRVSPPPIVAPRIAPLSPGISAPRVTPLSPGISAPRASPPTVSAPHISTPTISAPHVSAGPATSGGHPH